MLEWIGWRVDDVNGSSIGRLHDVIADENGRPEWLAIKELRFGEGRRFFAPAREATGSRGRVWLPIERDFVRGSAGLGSPQRSPQAERRLRAHYGSSERRVA
jgi:hypothetical protein